jgi:hypothetical protein
VLQGRINDGVSAFGMDCCQTDRLCATQAAWSPAPDATEVTMGNSGMNPKDASESCFVAAEGTGVVVPHIELPGDIVSLFLQTTRVVGTVDSEGFLTEEAGLLHLRPEQATLAPTLVLTIRAKVAARDLSDVNVEVVLHRGMTGRELPLGFLEGSFGSGWETYRLDVPVGAVRFPADPCPAQDASESCGQEPLPRPNEISFVFTGDIIPGIGLTFEVDWLMLEPRNRPRTALHLVAAWG